MPAGSLLHYCLSVIPQSDMKFWDFLGFSEIWKEADLNLTDLHPKLRTVSFAHFDLEMCFAPQRRAFFRHRNFQKCSGAEVFCTFWLGNVLRATTACTFASLIWPAGSAPAALASLLFDPPEPQIIGKTQCFATFLPFRAPGCSFFWDFLFLLLFSCLFLPISAFHLSILSEVWLLNFLRLTQGFWMKPMHDYNHV